VNECICSVVAAAAADDENDILAPREAVTIDILLLLLT